MKFVQTVNLETGIEQREVATFPLWEKGFSWEIIWTVWRPERENWVSSIHIYIINIQPAVVLLMTERSNKRHVLNGEV